MKSRSLLSFLALAVAAVSPALAAEVPSTPTETLAQLERIETQVRAARQEGQSERLAELREELRQLPVPAAEAVRASRIWASMQNLSTPATPRIDGKLDPVDNIKLPGTVWTLDDLELDNAGYSIPDSGGGPKSGLWSPDVSLLAATSVDESLPHPPPVKGNYWGLDLSISAITTHKTEPEPDQPTKTGYWDPEGFELAPRAEAERP